MSRLKSTIRDLLPAPFVSAYRRYRYLQLARANQKTTPEAVFTGIYTGRKWGGESDSFYSGPGSHESTMVGPYVEKLKEELARIGAETKTAVDLGCGDYSIGHRLSPLCGRYVGVDIVRPLIEHNQKTYGSANVQFRHANIVEDDLPEGEICFVREVLQHLSNAQIQSVIPKLLKYRWCFITEHHPSAGRLRRPNIDKPYGPDIRVSRGSGVFLHEPPFNVSKERVRVVLEVPCARRPESSQADDPGLLRTFVLERQ